MSKVSCIAVGFLTLAAIGCGNAWGQVLEEVTVTAQKREQNLQDVGISVVARSGESLRESGLADVVDAVIKIPNVDVHPAYGPGSTANIVIRGVGLNDFGEGHEAPVTTYVDELYVLSVPAVDFAMFDINRLEVLRGPQGTLFGRNSTGGLVNFVTARPTATPEGFIELTGARFGEYKLEAAVSGPLASSLSGRLSVVSDHSDGYIRNANPALKPAGQAGTDAVRGQLLWSGDTGLTILGKIEYGRRDTRHVYYEQEPAESNAANGGLWQLNPNGTDFAGYNQLKFQNGIAAGRDVADTNSPQYLKANSTTGLLRVEQQLGELTLTSLTGYLGLSRKLAEDCDASPNTICSANFPYSTDSVTEEIRLAKAQGVTRWTTGVYYLNAYARNTPAATFNIPVSGPAAVDPVTGLYSGGLFPISLAANWRLKTLSYSVFGQGEHDFAENLTGIVGARLTRDDKDFLDTDNASLRQCNNFPAPNNCFTDYTAQPYGSTYRKTLWSGRLELDWRPAPHALVYASFSRGSKAGGFNNGFYPGGIQPAQIPYGDEHVDAYEVGIKSTLADGRVRANFAAFHYNYKNFQTFNWEGIGGLIVNNDATVSGVEAEFEARVTEHLTADLNLAGLDTTIKNVGLRDGKTVRDTKMASAPPFSANGSLSYAMPIGSRQLSATWDFNYVARRYDDNFNDPAAVLESYFKHNAQIAYELTDGLKLAAFVNNISDRRNTIKVFVFDSLGYAQTIYAMPRTYGARLTYKW